MSSDASRRVLPDISDIAAFSHRLVQGGVSREEASSFLRGQLSLRLGSFYLPPSEIDPKKIILYKHDSQYGMVSGRKICQHLIGKLLLTEAHLGYFFANQIRIPESWKNDGNNTPRYVFFWGDLTRKDFVPYIVFKEGRWTQERNHMTLRWYVNYYAATYDPEF